MGDEHPPDLPLDGPRRGTPWKSRAVLGVLGLAIGGLALLASMEIFPGRPSRSRRSPTAVWGQPPGWSRLPHEYGTAVVAVVFAGNGGRIASADTSGIVKIWDRPQEPPSRVLSDPVGAGATALAFDPGGTMLSTGGYDGTVFLYETTGFRRVARLQGHAGMITALAFSPDGRRLVSAGGYRDGRVRLWDVATCRSIASYQSTDLTDGVLLAAMNPEGRVVAVEGRGTIDLLGSDRLELIKQAQGTTPPEVKIRRGADGHRRLVETGRRAAPRFEAVGRAPGGATIVTVDMGGTGDGLGCE